MFNEVKDELDDFRSETPQAFFRFLDGILNISIKSEMIIDMKTADRIEHFRREMTEGFAVPVLIEVPDNRLLLDNEAFHYFSSNESMKGCSAKALVVNAPLRVILKNLSVILHNSAMPFRVFRSKSEAKMWLFEHIPEEEFNEQSSNFV
ncbi:MAG: hypothetical protein ACI87V_001337 [Flavobacteriales bacterium]|jgi:hypothetical protein